MMPRDANLSENCSTIIVVFLVWVRNFVGNIFFIRKQLERARLIREKKKRHKFSYGKYTTIRLVFLGIMRDQLRSTLKPLEHHCNMILRGSRGPVNWTSIMPRGVSLSYGR